MLSPIAEALARRAAHHLVEMVSEAAEANGRVRIAISGGSTPKAAFQLLADPNQPWRERMPWEDLDLFWVDERTVPPDHPESNYRMTREALLDHVPLASAADPSHGRRAGARSRRGPLRIGACATPFASKAPKCPRFDLVSLGMGDDGHTASLFPHTAAIHEMGRLVTANQVPQKDTWRITLTWPVINHARSVFFLIAGADKAAARSRSFHGTARSRTPAQSTHLALKRYTHSVSG